MRDQDGFETRARGVGAAAALAAAALALVAPTALGASGNFDRTWGKDVVSSGAGDAGTAFEICVNGTGTICKTGSDLTQLGGEMNSPVGVATDPAGNVYVADSSNHRIQKFDSLGNFISTWGRDVVDPASPSGDTGTGFEVCTAAAGHICKTGVSGGLGGELDLPSSVAFDPIGNFVYVADNSNLRIQKFSPTGGFLRAWGEDVVDPTSPSGNTGGFEICVAADGHICKTGAIGSLGGELNFPRGLAVDPTGMFVYVADTNNHRVQRYTSLGAFGSAMGRDVVDPGSPSGDTGTGFEVCTGPAGHICKIGTTGGLGGEMDTPFGVGTDPAGNLYVADSQNHRIQKFDSSASFLRTWGEDVIDPTSPSGNDPGNGFEICVAADSHICKGGASGSLGGELSAPRGVAADSAGSLYAADGGNNRVQRFDLSGNFERAWGRDVISANGFTGFEICIAGMHTCKLGAPSGIGGAMSTPDEVAADAAGNLYVAEQNNDRIQRFAEPAPAGGGGGAATPSNAFTIGAIKGKVLSLTVPSAGEVKVADAAAASAGSLAFAAARGLKPSSATGGPGTISVRLKLTKSAKEKLSERGKVKVRAKITFTPTGGTASSQTAKLKIKR